MKKIFLIMGVMALFTTGFAANSESANVNVRAEVVDDLEIKTGNVDFGLVNRGNIDSPATPGYLEINGEQNKAVKVEILYNDVVLDKNGSIDLKNGTSVLKYVPKLLQQGTGAELENGSSIYLGDVGQAKFDIEGTLNVPENAVSGEHTGDMTVRVQYND